MLQINPKEASFESQCIICINRKFIIKMRNLLKFCLDKLIACNCNSNKIANVIVLKTY